MVRAELGAGNREAALELLERLKERCVADFSFFRPKTLWLTEFLFPFPQTIPRGGV
jgi:hypothetical protein